MIWFDITINNITMEFIGIFYSTDEPQIFRHITFVIPVFINTTYLDNMCIIEPKASQMCSILIYILFSFLELLEGFNYIR